MTVFPKLIAHRGLVNGADKKLENHPQRIIETLRLKIPVEIDVWYLHNTWWLGHDGPQYQVSADWLYGLRDHSIDLASYEFVKYPTVWIHCKNLDALSELTRLRCGDMSLDKRYRYVPNNPNSETIQWSKYEKFNYFFHEEDPVTMTSLGYIWAHPKVELIPVGSAWVVPKDKPQDFTNLNWGRAAYACVYNVFEVQEQFRKMQEELKEMKPK